MADEPTGAVWVYDPKTKAAYKGFPFEGLKVLELDETGQPKIPAAAEKAAESKEAGK